MFRMKTHDLSMIDIFTCNPHLSHPPCQHEIIACNNSCTEPTFVHSGKSPYSEAKWKDLPCNIPLCIKIRKIPANWQRCTSRVLDDDYVVRRESSKRTLSSFFPPSSGGAELHLNEVWKIENCQHWMQTLLECTWYSHNNPLLSFFALPLTVLYGTG